MNFKFRSPIMSIPAAQNSGLHWGGVLKGLLFAIFIVGCSPKSELNSVRGDVQVKIPVTSQSGNSSEYKLSVVTLKGLDSLKQVSGFFAQFFYAPGLNQNQLVGDSPQARFIKTKQNVYLPVDPLSQQMATLYYHMQNLAEFSKQIGTADTNPGPMKIGIETRVGDSESLSKNNAFYDGKSDAMLFVPFMSSELPIAVNSGIIAHEYFHSLFYKIVLNKIKKTAVPVAKNKLPNLYNETFLRGVNEGLADFWGWAYTNDDDFIRWSLSSYSKSRKLVLNANSIGQYETAESIFSKVEIALNSGPEPSEYLSDYIYKIGTPNARFLKQLAVLLQEGGLSSSEAKTKVAQSVIFYMKSLTRKISTLQESEILPAESLFEFIATEESQIKLNESQCTFVLSYVQKSELRTSDSCQKQVDNSFKISAAMIEFLNE